MIEAERRRRSFLRYGARALHAALSVALNYAIFFFAPRLFFSTLGLLTPGVEAAISSYFAAIGCLAALRVVLKGHLLGFAASVGLSVAQALFVYVVTGGGELSLTFGGLSVGVEFKPLVYLMVAAPLVNLVRYVYDYASKSSMQPAEAAEAVEG